jgi:GntR family transcriptional regulator
MEAEPTTGVPPVHHQIADSIRARIAAGDLKPGDAIPTINGLCTQWRCSAGTARSALSVLRAEGLITHGRGKAASVREPLKRIKLPQDFGQQQKDAVLLPADERSVGGAMELTSGIKIADTSQTYKYSTVRADAKLAEEFHVSADAPLVRREYEMRDPQNGYRLSFSISYIPKFLIESNPKLLKDKNEPWPGGHQHQLYTVGIELDRITRSVIAVRATPGTAQQWGMETGDPMLVVHSTSIDTKNRVVEISDATYPGDRSELEFTERLDRWPPEVITQQVKEGK